MKRNAFTLIELLVVVAIIVLLSVIGIATFSGVRTKAQDTVRKNDLQSLATALELYYQKNGSYPTPATPSNNCSPEVLYDNDSFRPLISGNQIPTDPKNNTQYCYISVNGGNGYRLFAKLEKCSDSTLCSFANYNYSLVSENLAVAPATGDILAKSPPCGVVGDANNDGQISAADWNLVLQWDGLPSLSDDQLARGDVNKREGVDSTDALCIRRYIDGRDSTLGACPDASSTTILVAGCQPP